MGFKEKVEEQALKLAEIYKTVTVLRIIANVNAVFLGALLVYMMMVGFNGQALAITFAMFLMNVSFFASEWLTQPANKVFK